MSPQEELQARYEFARQIGNEAGQLTLKYFQQPIDVDRKDDGSPVTIADREAESLLRRRIGEQFPDDGIVGEEFGTQDGTSNYRWILDPIDGTKSFVSGVPLYTTLIGVLENDAPRVGVIMAPALSESIHALTGQGAWYEQPDRAPCKAHVSSCSSLADAVFVTSERAAFDERNAAAAYASMEAAARLTRTWGDAYGYLLLATGRAEVMIDALLSVWDAAAVLPVVTEAGGTFTDWQGNSTIYAGEAIGTNTHVAAEALAITRQFPLNG